MTSVRFSPDERRLLLTTPGIGSLVERAVEQAGSGTWLNRRRALARAIQRAMDSTHTQVMQS